MAVSVGWTGDQSTYNATNATLKTSPVLLNPLFVDTSVGQQLFLADQLPWKLNKQTLPNGRANPVSTAFATAYDSFVQAKRQELLTAAEVYADRLIDGPRYRAAFEELAKRSTTIAVLLDDPAVIASKGGLISIEGSLRYRYITTAIRSGLNGVITEVRDIDDLAKIANANLQELSAVYPPLIEVAKYAKVVAFIRWARNDPHVARFNLSGLISVRASDHEKTPTPDGVKRD